MPGWEKATMRRTRCFDEAKWSLRRLQLKSNEKFIEYLDVWTISWRWCVGGGRCRWRRPDLISPRSGQICFRSVFAPVYFAGICAFGDPNRATLNQLRTSLVFRKVKRNVESHGDFEMHQGFQNRGCFSYFGEVCGQKFPLD